MLYAPPTVDGIPDAYTAILEYYTSKKLHNKCGTINLADCDEVLSSLDSELFKNVFGLHTKHKNQFRTYYLAAETETEMNKWVNRLCQVLGLTENDEKPISPPFNQNHRPSVVAMKINHEMNTRQMRPLTQPILSPEPPPLRPSAGPLSTPFTRLNVSESNLLEACSSKSYPPENRRDFSENIWRMPSPQPGSSKLRNAESVPELDRFSPAAIQREGHLPSERREFMELPPIPPDKTGGGQRQTVAGGIAVAGHGRGGEGLAYDQPRQRYYDRHDEKPRRGTVVTPPTAALNTEDDNSYNMPPTNRYKSCIEDLVETGWYNTPAGVESTTIGKKKVVAFPFGQTTERVRERHESEELYKIPSDHPIEDTSDEFYNVPKNLPLMNSNHADLRRNDGRKSIQKQRSEDCYNFPKSDNSPIDSMQDDDFYNVPKTQTGDRCTESYGMSNETRSNNRPSSVFGTERWSRIGDQLSDEDPTETYDVPKTKNKNRSSTGKHDVQNNSVYNVPGHQILTEDLYNTPKHSREEMPQTQVDPHGIGLPSQAEGHKAESYHPQKHESQPLSQPERLRVEKQQLPAQVNNQSQHSAMHASEANEVYDVPHQHPAKPSIPKKPSRPLSRPSPDRQLVVLNVPVEENADPTPAVASSSKNEDKIKGMENEKSENIIESPSEAKGKSNTFKQNQSLKSSLSGHKRSFQSHQQPGLGPVVVLHDSIRITQRTKSFKRSLPSQDRSALPLPIKRIIERSESLSSSSSDDNKDHHLQTTDDHIPQTTV